MLKKYSPEKFPTLVLLGRPNVGKSTLYNRLVGRQKAIESAEAGTTRDWQEARINCHKKYYRLIDCAGLEKTKNQQFNDINFILEQIIRRANLLLWIVDGSNGLDNHDRALISKIRSFNKPTWLIVNKCDNALRMIEGDEEFKRLGFFNVVMLSAKHNKNIHSLTDKIAEWLADDEEIQNDLTVGQLKFSIIGRPNVGKSSLLNALLKFKRSVISDIPGTTRDAVSIDVASSQLYWQDIEPVIVNFTDTAGIRRKNKITNSIENQSVRKAIEAIENSDIVLFVIDALESVSKQDLHVAGLASKRQKGIIIVVNKWDIILEKKHHQSNSALQSKFIENLLVRAKFLKSCPIIFTSAATAFNIDELRKLLQSMWRSRNIQISEKELANFIKKCQYPILKRISKIEQISTNPPTFLIFNQGQFHTKEINQLKNALTEKFNLFSSPVKIEFFQ